MPSSSFSSSTSTTASGSTVPSVLPSRGLVGFGGSVENVVLHCGCKLSTYTRSKVNAKIAKHNSGSGGHTENTLEKWVLEGNLSFPTGTFQRHIDNIKAGTKGTKIAEAITKQGANMLNLRCNQLNPQNTPMFFEAIKHASTLTMINLSIVG